MTHSPQVSTYIRHQLSAPNLDCVSSALGVTLTRRLSASEDIQRVISDCSQSLYALCVLHHHGLADAGLHTVFHSVVVAKLLYACSAWNRFITDSDRHCIDAFLHRSKRCSYCQPDLLSSDQLVQDSDEGLFHKLCTNTGHTINYLLPPLNMGMEHYNLRSSTSSHNRQLPTCTGHLRDAYTLRQLYILTRSNIAL